MLLSGEACSRNTVVCVCVYVFVCVFVCVYMCVCVGKSLMGRPRLLFCLSHTKLKPKTSISDEITKIRVKRATIPSPLNTILLNLFFQIQIYVIAQVECHLRYPKGRI